ncbi:hypothetical protein GMRT_10503 [Giardia muris]|uniref:Uncharacterized protein n=1 Tax=Giardia muris TaxID=5742 RepID=A0A4Z1SLH9_GIAMU|nr:hypothetical protein GMRT_10503 [Giardia muris]|eukprot:TNJ26506.1 hypothetical protein GMRT_10503 [Giardia muris]
MNRVTLPLTILGYKRAVEAGKSLGGPGDQQPRITLAGQVLNITRDGTSLSLGDGTETIELSAPSSGRFELSPGRLVRVHLLAAGNTGAAPKTLFYESLPSAEAIIVHFVQCMNALKDSNHSESESIPLLGGPGAFPDSMQSGLGLQFASGAAMFY